MGAAAFIAGRQLRRAGRRTIALAVVLGIASGVVVAAAAGGRRTQTAVDRLAAYSRLPDLSFFGPHSLVAEASRRPEVVEAHRNTYAPLAFLDVPVDDRERIVPFASLDANHLRRIERPIVVAGRLPDPQRINEIAVSEPLASRRSASPGAVLRARTFLPADLEDFEPTGPVIGLRVTGVVRQLTDLTKTSDEQGDSVSGEELVYLTPAFYRAHVRPLPGFGEQSGMNVRLRRPADAATFRRAVIAANGGELPGDGQVFGFFSPREQAAVVDRAVDVEANSLYAFAALSALAAVAVLGQMVARRARSDAGDFAALTSLGLSPRQMILTALVRDGAVALAAAVICMVVAIAASPFAPIGLARRAEPHGGVSVNVAMITIGAALAALTVVVAGTIGTALAARAARQHRPSDRPSTVASALARVGAGAPAVIGARFALEAGRGPTSIPARSTLAGAAIGVGAVVAAFTVGAGLDRVLERPSLQGAPWDVAVSADGDNEIDMAATLAEDDRIQRFSPATTAETTAGGKDLVVVGVEDRALLPPPIRGRVPVTAGELALTRAASEQLRASIGDTVAVTPSDGGRARRLRVVGLVPVAAQLLEDRAGVGAIASFVTARNLGSGSEPFWVVQWRRGVNQQAARDDLQQTFNSAVRPFRSPDVRNLTRVSWLPSFLAGALGILSVGTLVHALVSAVRRRRRDLAILKTIGFDRRQVRSSVRWHATTVAVFGAALGVPLGLAAGRWLWRVIGERAGVVPEPVVPWLPLALVAIGVLVVALLVSAIPARSAARTRPAVVLRTE